jgi:hypothetical protein
VQVDLSLSEGVLSLEVSDNGRGMSDADLAKARSFGIRGLHERASHVGGWVDLSSSAAGTSLIVSVPLADLGGGEGAPRADERGDAPRSDEREGAPRPDERAGAPPPAVQNADPPEPGTP